MERGIEKKVQGMKESRRKRQKSKRGGGTPPSLFKEETQRMGESLEGKVT